MVTRTHRRARGQAMVETVLGIIVFVTILMFGIHFAEVGFLSLKVQEASASALWDTTSAKMHELPGNFGPLSNAISGAGGSSTSRYQDFDGRTSKSGGSAPVLVYTSASGLTVECKDAGGISFAPSASTNSIYKNTGGMTCSSKATLSPTPRLTKSFLDQGQGSLFQVAHLAGGIIPVCGVGRASGGDCKGSFGILLDDWGLAGANESKECKVLDGSVCSNSAYYQSAKKVFDYHNPGTSASQALARAIVGMAPVDPSKFWMSFVGEDGSFKDKENGGDSDPNNWVTTPGAGSPTTEYSTSYSNRENCFLGSQCP
jgi:hypothetical protein